MDGFFINTTFKKKWKKQPEDTPLKVPLVVDGQEIYEIKRAKVGVFRGIDYPDYPFPSEHSRGGRLGE